MIFTPVYKIYKKAFIKNIIANTKIESVFEKYGDTSVYEKYMLNAAQFSAAKNLTETKLLQSAVFDNEGNVKSYSQYKRDAEEITDLVNDTWMRTEWESQRSQISSLNSFEDMVSDSDLYPYWVYHGVMDDREREEHVELEDKVFRIGDPEGDDCYPPNGWNCRCEGDSVDDQYLSDNNVQLSNGSDAIKFVDEQFRFNAYRVGTLPNSGSYFDTLPNANKANGKMFSDDDKKEEMHALILTAKGMHAMIEIKAEWEKEYHVDKLNNIVFQNKELYTNIVFSDNSLHAITTHSKGFELLPETIMQPDQVWSSWEDPVKQQTVLRNYIKGQYVVFTRQGIVSDAYLVAKSTLPKFQKGVILSYE